ncbi:MAG: hypothetical protein ACJATT_003348 [Myxococcota bacterium]
MDTSVALHDRFEHKSERWLKREIGQRIKNADVVLIFGNMAITNSEWCVWELNQAIKHRQNILVVRPTQYSGNTPRRVLAADNMGGPATNADTILRRLESLLRVRLKIGAPGFGVEAPRG